MTTINSVKRGDTVMFNYTAIHMIPPRALCGRSLVKKVLREKKQVLVTVWNGRTGMNISDQYDDILIPVSCATVTKKKTKKANR